MLGKKINGMTLIELTLVVIIISILTTISIPVYKDYIVKNNRIYAQSALKQLALSMQDYYNINYSYHKVALEENSQKITNNGIPRFFHSKIPFEGNEVIYKLKITNNDGISYMLQAIPQEGDNANDGILSLDSQGREFWDRNNDKSFTGKCELNWNSYCNE